MNRRRNTAAAAVIAVVAVLACVLAACEPASAPWTTDVPSGSLDEVALTGSTLTVRGWAGDRNADEPVSVVVTLDGHPQQGTTVADGRRPDVAQLTSRGARSGFTRTIEGVTDPEVLVCVVAINVGPGDHGVLGCRVPTPQSATTSSPPTTSETSTSTTTSTTSTSTTTASTTTTSTTTTTTSTTIPPDPPTVTSLSPVKGPTTGGTAVTITGARFAGATGVTFGSTPASSFTVDSDTSIRAVAPVGSVGVVDITVTTADGTSATGAGREYTYGAPPTITSMSPSTGIFRGGTAVVITGTGFSTATQVKFGSRNATFTVTNDRAISVTSPSNPLGSHSVTVTNPYGTSNGKSFVYVY